MAQVHTHYDNLKVARDAPPEVIRAAYKTLCQKYHPDRNGNSADAIRVIQIINSAYAVLSDPEKRREHDEWIARTEAVSQETPGFSNTDFISGRSVRRSSHRSRRKTPFDFLIPRHHASPRIVKAVQKAVTALDQFSRKLFRKI